MIGYADASTSNKLSDCELRGVTQFKKSNGNKKYVKSPDSKELVLLEFVNTAIIFYSYSIIGVSTMISTVLVYNLPSGNSGAYKLAFPTPLTFCSLVEIPSAFAVLFALSSARL